MVWMLIASFFYLDVDIKVGGVQGEKGYSRGLYLRGDCRWSVGYQIDGMYLLIRGLIIEKA